MKDIQESSGNVYADIDSESSQEMLVKAELAASIKLILENRGLTQQEAAAIIDLPQPKLSRLLSGHFRGISEAKMISCITKLGRDVQIVISQPREMPGHLSVLHAG